MYKKRLSISTLFLDYNFRRVCVIANKSKHSEAGLVHFRHEERTEGRFDSFGS